MQFIQQQATF